MSDVNRVITLGVGPASDISGFILTGLNVSQAVVFTGILGVTARRRIEALDAQAREAMYLPGLILLPDGSGYVLAGDDERVMHGEGRTGQAGQVKRRIETLKVKR